MDFIEAAYSFVLLIGIVVWVISFLLIRKQNIKEKDVMFYRYTSIASANIIFAAYIVMAGVILRMVF